MANFTIPKITLGSDKKPMKSMNLTHDVSTTADFCFPQPIMCQEMVPGSKGILQNATVVRLAPLVAPSYGVVTYNTYYRFVPIAELYTPFEEMLAGQPFYASSTNYIPNSVPKIQLYRLTAWLLANYATFSVYKRTGGQNSDGSYTYNFLNYSDEDTDVPAAVQNFNSVFGLTVGLNALSVDTYASSITASQYDTVSKVELEGADYISKSGDWLYAFRFTRDGLHLRKILLGLGYQLDIENSAYLSILPICAYYKAWFDLFAPQQSNTWSSTNCFKLLDALRETSNNNVVPASGTSGVGVYFTSLISDLTNCWYVSDPDFVSAHIATPAISSTNVNLSPNSSITLGNFANVSASANYTPYISPSNPINKATLDLMVSLTKWINKNTIIGGRIDKYLRTHFGADYVNAVDSYRIGEDVVLCDIDPVISQAQTTEKTLGSYAGAGVGSSAGKKMSFTADTFGYWIGIAVVIPASAGYAQGVDPKLYHLDRFTFYNPEFDAKGFEITSKDQVFGSNDVATLGHYNTPVSFGFIPRYSGYKVAQNIINGNISLRSTRTDYLPYTLDRYISPGELQASPVYDSDGVASTTQFKVTTWSPSLPIANEEFRYLGKYEFMGNFNRVFQNEGYDAVRNSNMFKYMPMEDNFIIHNFMQFEYIAPMLPLSESFDTDSDRNNNVSVEKA